uniref:Import inner membrane translocase subunit n=1 Tax=Noccaea caerulescens TaxID=107243 RepID=A0A1J3FV74_NOCCA
MVKPSDFKAVQGFIRLHYSRVNPVTIGRSNPSALSSNRISQLQPRFSLSSKPASTNVGLSQILSSPKLNPKLQALGLPRVNLSFSSAFRLVTTKSSGFRKVDGNFARKVVDKPVKAVSSTFTRYRGAIGLHIDAFWKKNSLILVGAGGVFVCIFLWRIMFGIASTFVGLSEGMAKYGFLALSSAIVAFGGLYLRSRFTINPDKVYRMTMRKINTAAEILEVMGAPLAGSDLRAYVMSGGGITFKKFKPTIRSKRCFLLFPVQGSERKGLVSVEVKKKKGQYDMKLLAVDIPMASGPDQRLFLVGDEEEYRVGGGLISELRDPVVKAMAATKEFDNLDRIEEEEDAERELEEAERKHREEIEKLEKESS